MSIETGPLPLAVHHNHFGHAKEAALACMLQALDHLDGDPTIPALIGAQLQLAMDTLISTIQAVGFREDQHGCS